jgi:hypothetical protein
MAKSSRDFQTLVYIRNVTSDLEQYSFDLEMLEIFYAVDGCRTVAEVARDLGKTVNEVKGPFTRLSRQKLILSAPRRIGAEPGIAGFLETEPAMEGSAGLSAPKSLTDPPVECIASPRADGTPVDDLASAETKIVADSSGVSAQKDGFDPSPPDATQESASRSVASIADVIEFEDLHDLIDAVGSDVEEPFGAEHPLPPGSTPNPFRSFDDQAEASPENGPGSDQASSFDRDRDDDPGPDPFGFVEHSTEDPESSSGGLFSFSRPASQPSKTFFDAFGRHSPAVETGPTPFAAKGESEPDYSLAADEPSLEAEEQSPPYNAKGMEHFEQGLAALKDKLYKEALVQFELASELDPHNRLCRANIQRIRAILGAEK